MLGLLVGSDSSGGIAGLSNAARFSRSYLSSVFLLKAVALLHFRHRQNSVCAARQIAFVTFDYAGMRQGTRILFLQNNATNDFFALVFRDKPN